MFNHKHKLIISTLIFFLTLTTTHADEPSSEPILRIETGMHTDAINQIGVDAAERFLLTASDDKTLRLWDLHTGNLLKTYRVPIGAGNEVEGKLFSGAISPDGEWVAGGGITGYEWDNKFSIYLFNRASGKLIKRLSGLEESILHLCVSKDGQYLGASLGGANGVRVWDTQTWLQMFSDTDYADSSYCCDFDQQNRLVTSSDDGYLRLYSPASNGFELVAKSEAPGGKKPWSAVFSPTGDKIAVGFNSSINVVNVLDGHHLTLLYAPDTTDLDVKGSLPIVAWSQDGNSLYAGWAFYGTMGWILHWSQSGLGNSTVLQGATNIIRDIHSLKNGGIVYGTIEPSIVILDNAANKIVEREASIADYRLNWDDFLISHDGNTVQFSFEVGERPARFSLPEQSLIHYPQQDTNLAEPDTTSLKITEWFKSLSPKLNGNILPLFPNEISHSLAIAPDKSKFLLGTEWALHLFDTEGEQIWSVLAPSAAISVNISGDGKFAVAAFGDGTIRWYNLENGEELLTFFPHKDGRRWIAWTKSGYYMSSSEKADNLIGWHVNNGKDKEASFYPASALYASYKRPDIVKKILETLDEDEAIRLANLEKVVDPPIKVGEAIEKVKDKYQVKLEPSGLGKAIIIAASGEQTSNTLFPYSNEFTMKMYRLLHKSGFSDGDIIYMNPYPPIVPANGYVDAARQDFPMRDPKTELQQAIAQASQDLQPGEQFVFYLHGHARADSVRIGRQSEMSAQEIKTLLAQIPTDVEQIIILDTCYSGSFLDELASVTKRVVITSADADSKAWSTESMSFAESFIRQLRYGRSVGEAFELAKTTIISEPKIFGAQRPQLDDTQDGLYAEEDGHFAGGVYLGGKKEPGTLPPEIIEVHPIIRLVKSQSTATLWVKASPDFNSMKQVRAILVNEHDKAVEYQGDNTQFTQQELILKPNEELQRYEIEYNQFHTANNWKILYQAQNLEGDWSDIRMGYVVSVDIFTKVEPRLNQTTYQLGDHLQLEVTAYGKETVDLYVGIIFPQGHYQTITSPLNFSLDNVLQPYKTGIQLTGEQTFPFPNLELPTTTTGDYQACGLLTQPKSDPLNEANWLHLDCKGFSFQ